MASISSVSATFSASIKSVGTAVVMAGIGFYLHKRNFITKEGKRSLALMSQQVTFPLYFFTKIIYCNQDWSDKPCPDVTQTLNDTWMLLLWPIYMVGMGLLVGKLVVWLTGAPKHQEASVLAATAFANNTALPITLLAVIHANFPSTSDLGRIDPTLFLSVYLVVYPILQWSLGGWILAPDDDEDEQSTILSRQPSLGDSIRQYVQNPLGKGSSLRFRNVVNNKGLVDARKDRTGGLTSNDEGCYMTQLDFEKLEADWNDANEHRQSLSNDFSTEQCLSKRSNEADHLLIENVEAVEKIKDASSKSNGKKTEQRNYNSLRSATQRQLPTMGASLRRMQSQRSTVSMYETDSLWETIHNILERTLFQPPVIGALLGILCACTPARGIFVDVVNRHSGAPLQWLFDGLYKIGSIAVPDNMLILGCNLSASYISHVNRKKGDGTADKTEKQKQNLTTKTMIGIVVGKMLIMPFIGITTTYILKNYVLSIADEIAGAFYLVLMIVFLTPTANNVMIMIELADCEIEVLEGAANCIAMQYVVAPIILSFTMTVAIGVASEWS